MFVKLTLDSVCIQGPLLVQVQFYSAWWNLAKNTDYVNADILCAVLASPFILRSIGRSSIAAESVKPTSWFEIGVQLIMEQAPHIRTFWDTNSHLRKGDRYVQVSQRESNKGNFEVKHSTGEIGGLRGKPVYKKYKSSQDAQREFDRLCSEALQHGCAWEHNELTHGRIVIDFTNWPSIALW